MLNNQLKTGFGLWHHIFSFSDRCYIAHKSSMASDLIRFLYLHIHQYHNST